MLVRRRWEERSQQTNEIDLNQVALLEILLVDLQDDLIEHLDYVDDVDEELARLGRLYFRPLYDVLYQFAAYLLRLLDFSTHWFMLDWLIIVFVFLEWV